MIIWLGVGVLVFSERRMAEPVSDWEFTNSIWNEQSQQKRFQPNRTPIPH